VFSFFENYQYQLDILFYVSVDPSSIKLDVTSKCNASGNCRVMKKQVREEIDEETREKLWALSTSAENR